MTPARGRPEFLKRLKGATASQHEHLEKRVDLLGSALTLERYKRLLKGMLGFYAPVEAQLVSTPEWAQRGFDFGVRQKLPLLRRDLVALGMTGRAVEGIHWCRDLPELDSFAQVLGCAYVLEGATLGGQIITRQLTKTLGVSAGSGAAFFASYGVLVGPMWQEFCGFLANEASSEEVATSVILSAQETFVKLEGWLVQEGL